MNFSQKCSFSSLKSYFEGLPGFQKDAPMIEQISAVFVQYQEKTPDLIVPFWEIAASGGAGCGRSVWVNMEHPETCPALDS